MTFPLPSRLARNGRPVVASGVVRSAMLALATSLAACTTVGPDYRVPDTAMPSAFRAGATATAGEADLSQWWTRFDDPLLTQLVTRALAGGYDVRQAQARLREARARRGFAEADRFPTISSRTGASRQRRSDEVGFRSATELYSAGFDASWELDLFGARRRALEAADASLDAAGEDLRDVRVSLSAEVALNYVETRAFQARLALASASLAAQRDTHDIARWRNEAGLVTALDVEQARTALEQTRAQIPLLAAGFEQAKNRLAILLAENPGALDDLLAPSVAVPTPPQAIATGVPADLLRRRPDIRQIGRAHV